VISACFPRLHVGPKLTPVVKRWSRMLDMNAGAPAFRPPLFPRVVGLLAFIPYSPASSLGSVGESNSTPTCWGLSTRAEPTAR